MESKPTSSLPPTVTSTVSPTTETPSKEGMLGDKTVTHTEGQSIVGNNFSEVPRFQPATMLWNRQVKHFRTVKLIIRLAALFANRSSLARNFVIARTQDLASTLIYRDDDASLRSAHQLLDNLAGYQAKGDKELPLWRCKAYETLGNSYRTSGNQSALTRLAASVKDTLTLLEEHDSVEHAQKVAKIYQEVVENLDESASLPAMKQACNFVVEMRDVSPDCEIESWQREQTERLVGMLQAKETPGHREQAIDFLKQMDHKFKGDTIMQNQLRSLKGMVAPVLFALDNMRDNSAS